MWLRRLTVRPYLQALRRSPNSPWLLSSTWSSSSTAYYSDIPRKKSKIAPLQERKMIDRHRLWAKGGEGGNGCYSFRRTRYDRRGKPDGGNGGRGGDVILECSPAVWDFRNLQHHVNAKRGGHGLSKDKIGSRGSDKVVQVPVGTVIHLVDGEVPTVLEDRSLKALDPWELPGALEVDDQSVSEFEPTSHSQNKMEVLEKTELIGSLGVEKRTGKSGNMQKAMRRSSAGLHVQSSRFSKEQSRPHVEEFVSYRGDGEIYSDSVEDGDGGEIDDDSVEADSVMSEMEWDEDEDEDEEEAEEEEEEEIQYNVAELTEPGQRVIIARGGEGGLGNVSLGKHSIVNKRMKDDSPKGTASNLAAPDDEDHSSLAAGEMGAEAVLVLELKSIADVGLVGMPNAGKSTLLGAISKAKPTVGHYAFTTLRPNIGNLNYDDFFSVTVADIPGLIKGAHVNRGLGHAFLRHIERTKVLAYVVDLAAALDGRKGIPPWEQLGDLVMELECHQVGLSDRPSLIVANKIDEKGAEDVYEELKRRVQGVPIFPVCAVLEEGVPELKTGLRSLVDSGESARLELDNIILD